MNVKKCIAQFFVASLLLGQCYASNAQDLFIAVASNFTAPMKELVTQFEKDTGQKVRLSLASSGKLYAQISKGAPFDLFFSADQRMPTELVEKGFAVDGSQFTYAKGKLALWSNNKEIEDSKLALKSLTFNKLAIANPKLAPFGIAAMQTMGALGVSDKAQERLVMGENVSQVYQFVYSGNADLGFVALSQIIASDQTQSAAIWKIPVELHDPILQDAVITLKGVNNPSAQRFIDYVQSDASKNIIQAFGYTAD